MKICLLTAYTGEDWKPLADMVLPSFYSYADLWGHDIYVLEESYRDRSWHYPWQKTAWVRDVMEENPHDFYWVLDLDIYITNNQVDVRSFLDDRHHIYMARDISGHLNCGSYLVRNSVLGRQWLDAIMSMRESCTSEQDAIIKLSKAPLWKAATKVLEHPSINSVDWTEYESITDIIPESQGQWFPGHLTCHLPGRTPQDRCRIFQQFNRPFIDESC